MNQSLLMSVMMNNHFQWILKLSPSRMQQCLFQCYLHILQEADVSTFTGIEGPKMFKEIFEMPKSKAQVMMY